MCAGPGVRAEVPDACDLVTGQRPGSAALYRCDENGGATVFDFSGHGNDGTNAGVTYSIDTPFPFSGNHSLVFDDEADSIDVPAGPATNLNSYTELSLEAFIKPTDTAGLHYILWADDGPFAMLINANLLSFVVAGSSGTVTTSIPFTDIDVWTHVAGTYDGATARLYVDGLQVASQIGTAGTITVSPVRNLIRIGNDETADCCGSGLNRDFRGLIDQVRITRQALDPAEILFDATHTLTPNPSSDCNENGNPDACDLLGRWADGTLLEMGTLVVAHETLGGTHAISQLTAAGLPIRQFGEIPQNEFRAHLAISGNHVFRSQGEVLRTISRYDRDGALVNTIVPTTSAQHVVWTITRDFSDTSIHFMDLFQATNVIHRLDDFASGSFTPLTVVPSSIRELDFDDTPGNEALYALFAQGPGLPFRIARIEPDATTTFIDSPDLVDPFIGDIGSIAVDSVNGLIYVATGDFGSEPMPGRLIQFDVGGAQLQFTAFSEIKPSLDVDVLGNIYVGHFSGPDEGTISMYEPANLTRTNNFNLADATRIVDLQVVPDAPVLALTDCNNNGVLDECDIGGFRPDSVAQYRVDMNDGATVLDYSGSDNHGNNFGVAYNSDTPFPTAGNRSLESDDETDAVTLPAGPATNLNAYTELTLEAFIKPTDTSGLHFILWADDGPFTLSINNNLLGFGVVGTGGSAAVNVAFSATGTWTHVAGRYDGATVKVYVNGQEAASQPAAVGTIQVSPNRNIIRIGNDETADFFGFDRDFGGLIDEIRIADRALTDDEIFFDATHSLVPGNTTDEDDNGILDDCEKPPAPVPGPSKRVLVAMSLFLLTAGIRVLRNCHAPAS